MLRDAGSIPAASILSICDIERQVETNTEVTDPPENSARTPIDTNRPQKTIVGQTTGQTVADGQSATIDPELRSILAAWPTLPVAIRAGVLAMVRAVL